MNYKEMFPNLKFKDEIEGIKNIKKYIELKGVHVHRQIYNILNFYYDEVLYEDISDYIRYDKATRNELYKFLALVEEHLISQILNNYDLVDLFDKSNPEMVKNIDEYTIKSDNKKCFTNMYKYINSEKMTFPKIIDLAIKLKLTYISNSEYKYVKNLRNSVMHHKLLLIGNATTKNAVEENIRILEGKLISLYNILPDKTKNSFMYQINKNNNYHNTPNSLILRLKRFKNGEFISEEDYIDG